MVSLDNFGEFLAGHFGVITSGHSRNLVRVDGIPRVVGIIGFFNSNLWNDSSVFSPFDSIQVGQSSVPATRQDFKIGSALPSSPENSKFTCIPAGYNSGLGKITISATLGSTGGSGTILESVKTQAMVAQSNIADFIFFRDVITPVIFISGQQIFVTYEVLI